MPTPVLEDYFAIFSEIHLYIFENLFLHLSPPMSSLMHLILHVGSAELSIGKDQGVECP